MSFAMAPKKSFFNLVSSLFKKNGILCFQMQPVWGCQCNQEQYNKLPDLNFNFAGMDSSSSKYLQMPKEAYMMHKK